MRRKGTPVPERRSLRAAWAAVAVLLGLLAMHGLSPRASTSDVHPSVPGGATAVALLHDGEAGAEPVAPSEERHHGAIAWCVAVLAALGLAALQHMVLRHWYGRRVRRDHRLGLVRDTRQHRPPALTPVQLCVLRC